MSVSPIGGFVKKVKSGIGIVFIFGVRPAIRDKIKTLQFDLCKNYYKTGEMSLKEKIIFEVLEKALQSI